MNKLEKLCCNAFLILLLGIVCFNQHLAEEYGSHMVYWWNCPTCGGFTDEFEVPNPFNDKRCTKCRNPSSEDKRKVSKPPGTRSPLRRVEGSNPLSSADDES